jgi:nucleolar protein 12
LNGSLFDGKHIRVDHAYRPKEKAHDTKKSVFLGNLAFDIQDEEVWQFFEDCGDIEAVRIVRDKKTNVGKGFGYVQFKDRATVGLALKLNDKPLGKSQRKIRVLRVKKEGGTQKPHRADLKK